MTPGADDGLLKAGRLNLDPLFGERIGLENLKTLFYEIAERISRENSFVSRTDCRH